MPFTVKDEDEFMLRMLPHQSLQNLMAERANAFKPVVQQKACIYSYPHSIK